MTCIRKITILF